MVAIAEIQGRGHVSPLLGETVAAAGVVTALRFNGFYMQDPVGDGDDATSEGVFVFTGDAPSVSIGDRVDVGGVVNEFQPGGSSTNNLTSTQIAADSVAVTGSGDVPAAVILGENGRAVPDEVIDDDGLLAFEPETDGIDFFESVEAMVVAVEDAVAVAPTSRFGEIPILADNGGDAEDRTNFGGVFVAADDFNPQRIIVDDAITSDPAQVNVGDRFDGVIEGVIDYSFGNFKLLNTAPLPEVIEGPAEPETTDLVRAPGKLTIAAYNVLNLDPSDGSAQGSDDQMTRVASHIANNLAAPDIVALQEIQDNDGTTNDGVTAANETFERLIEAIEIEGGPKYDYAQIDPLNNQDGGVPGGNIRVGYLYDPARVSLHERGDSGATTAAVFGEDGLDPNPGRIDPENPIFDGTRKSLAAEFTFEGESVYVINNHLSSKFGSLPLYGDQQPATDITAAQREAEARVLRDTVKNVLDKDPSAKIVVLGDFNEFEFRETHQILEDAGLTNKVDFIPTDDRYTFNFEGNSEILDSIFVSPAFAGSTEIDIVHVNTPFNQANIAGSDHDPIVARIDVGATPTQLVGRYAAGGDENLIGGAEINAYDAASQRLFISNGADETIDIVSISDPANPELVRQIDVTSLGGGLNSVAAKSGVIVAAIASNDDNGDGGLFFFDSDGELTGVAPTGNLPDQVTLTSDGRYALVANEGEPTDDGDPEASITIVDTMGADFIKPATQLDFSAFDGHEDRLRDEGVRIFPGKSSSEDFEPEYISIANDDSFALVTLQENNAIARIDLETKEITDVRGLGYKDHSIEGNGLDASDRDGGINIQTHPVFGLYQPDAIDNFTVGGEEFFVIANEGDSRDEDERIKDLELDPDAFPNAEELQEDENLGRLEVSTIDGDADGDGDFDQLFSYGGRSFSILNAHGDIVFDSGDQLERIVASQTPAFHNSNGAQDSFDGRSDNKGPEPEGVVTFVQDGKPMAAIGLERAGGFVLYDLSNPHAPAFEGYVSGHNPSFPDGTLAAGDLSPEGLSYITAEESPTGEGLLVVSNEFSGTTSLWRLDDLKAPEPENFKLQVLAASDLEGGVEAIENAPLFAGLVEHFQDESDIATLTLSAGDNVIPGPFFNAATDDALSAELTEVYQDLFGNDALVAEGGQGRVDITIMNILDFDASAVGNHEFDAGDRGFEGYVRPEDGYPGPEFPYLSGNLAFEESRVGDLATDQILETKQFSIDNGGDPVKIAQAAVAVKDGEEIGIIGATTQLLDLITSPGSVGVQEPSGENDMEALAAILQPIIDDVTARGVDKVVLVTHLQQIALEKELIGLVDDVDIVIAGGSDVLFADETDILRPGDDAPEEAFPFVTETKSGDPAVIIGSRGEYQYLARLVVEFDENGQIIADSIDPNESGAYAALPDVVEAVVGDELGERAEQVAGLTEAISGVVLAADGETFGTTDVFLEGRRELVRTEETNLGNLTADANLAYAKTIDPDVVVSLKNGGGIRAEIGGFGPNGELLPPAANPLAGKEEGDVSQLDIDNALRFNNGLAIVTTTREGLVELLEHAVAASGDGATPGRFPQVGGLSFSFDPDLPANDRIQSLAVLDEDGNVADVIVQNGDLVGNGQAELKLVTLSFLAGGGDGYPFEAVATDIVDLEQPEDAERTGLATFAADGSEQDTLAELLEATFGDTPFAQAETPAAEDLRIQNLNERPDTVLDGGVPVTTAAIDLDDAAAAAAV